MKGKEMINILHLSDLHFGTFADATNWYSQLADDLTYELQCLSIDLLILSGDIANKSTPREYSAAEQFIRSLSRDFQIASNKIVVVPGNHDVNWTLSRKAYSLRRREDYKGPINEKGHPDESFGIDKGEFVEVLNTEKYKRRLEHFRAFYEAITGTSYPLDYSQQAILHHYPEHKLVILGLNSAWQLDHHYTSRAGIYSDALSEALTIIRKKPEVFGQCLKIAVWHHPISSSGDDRITEHGFLQRLAQSGFFLGLHGHIHKADTGLYRYDRSLGGRKIEISSAGTFGAPIRQWTPGYPLQYNLIRLHENQLVVETRARTEPNGAWKPDAIWTQGPGRDPLPRYEIALPTDISATRFVTTSSTLEQSLEIPSQLHGSSETKSSADILKQQETPIPHKKVLILAVSPMDTPRLRLDKEVREICNSLWQARKVKFTVETRWAVRVQDLSRALLEFEPQIIHFCGHGSSEGGVILEDEMGHSHLVSPDALAGLFDLFADTVEGVVESVFLNACYTESQAAAIAPYVNYIVGTRSAIADEDAITFSTAFYEALANGRSYEFAFAYATRVARAKGTVADIAPVIQKTNRPMSSSRNSAPTVGKSQTTARRVLYLAASPKNMPRIRLDEEIREILHVLNASVQSGEYIVQQRWGARFDDLHQALLDFRPQIVHFSGHGTKDGLIFEDEIGNAHLVGIEPLTRLFELFAHRIECVLLSTNWSDGIAKQVSNHIKYVIGASSQVGDQGAIAFAVGFYRALGSQESIEGAFKSGCINFEHRTGITENPYTLNNKRATAS